MGQGCLATACLTKRPGYLYGDPRLVITQLRELIGTIIPQNSGHMPTITMNRGRGSSLSEPVDNCVQQRRGPVDIRCPVNKWGHQRLLAPPLVTTFAGAAPGRATGAAPAAGPPGRQAKPRPHPKPRPPP